MARPAKDALYDKDSLSWKYNSQAFVLLGGPRAAILQVCEPGVASGVASYSTYLTDPFGRLERTLDAMLSISFGPAARRERVLAGLNRAHAEVSGTLEGGAPYNALEPARQFWVLATLTDTVIEVDRRYAGRMTPAERAAYYEESKLVAEAFGIPSELVPDDYDAFRDYFAEMVATLEPNDDSRRVADTLVVPRVGRVPGVAWLPLTLVTIELLPRRMRRELGIRDLNPAELATVRAGQLVLRNSLGHVASALPSNPYSSRAIQDTAA